MTGAASDDDAPPDDAPPDDDAANETPHGGESFSFVMTAAQAGERLDRALAGLCADLSRSRLQSLIAGGRVCVNGAAAAASSLRLKAGDAVTIAVPPPAPALPKAENIPLAIVYEDAHLLVLNKQAGLVVHPGAGNPSGTLVNALLHHCARQLSGIGGVMRPGIVHRLDKDTSGLMVVAKDNTAHQGLAAQLEDRSLSRQYQALVFKTPFPPHATIDRPIGRHPSHRLKMAVMRAGPSHSPGGRRAVTHYRTEKSWGQALALMRCRLETGRTHQIRVHMQALGHPLIGDPLYGPQATALRAALERENVSLEVTESILTFPRQALHACKIRFIHPVSGQDLEFEAPMPEDMQTLLAGLLRYDVR